MEISCYPSPPVLMPALCCGVVNTAVDIELDWLPSWKFMSQISLMPISLAAHPPGVPLEMGLVFNPPGGTFEFSHT